MKHMAAPVTMAAVLLFASGADAGELVYQPINPSFGGNPFNSPHLLATAEINNQFTDDGFGFDFGFDEPTLADQFTEALSGSVIGATAQQITEAIFGDGALPSGTFTLDDAIVSYVTVSDRVIITVNDGITTSVLDIPVP